MENETSETVRKRSLGLAHDLVAELTQHILLGKLAPGDKLPSENTLVREHGVSRTVVREALSKLQASGLVEPRHGIGTFVMARQAQAGLRMAAESAANVRDRWNCVLAWKARPPPWLRCAVTRGTWCACA